MQRLWALYMSGIEEKTFEPRIVMCQRRDNIKLG